MADEKFNDVPRVSDGKQEGRHAKGATYLDVNIEITRSVAFSGDITNLNHSFSVSLVRVLEMLTKVAHLQSFVRIFLFSYFDKQKQKKKTFSGRDMKMENANKFLEISSRQEVEIEQHKHVRTKTFK